MTASRAKNLDVDARGLHALLWTAYTLPAAGPVSGRAGRGGSDRIGRGQERVGPHAQSSRAGPRRLAGGDAPVGRREGAGRGEGARGGCHGGGPVRDRLGRAAPRGPDGGQRRAAADGAPGRRRGPAGTERPHQARREAGWRPPRPRRQPLQRPRTRPTGGFPGSRRRACRRPARAPTSACRRSWRSCSRPGCSSWKAGATKRSSWPSRPPSSRTP